MLLLCAAAFAQRPVNLELTLTSPGNDSYHPPMQSFAIDVLLTNTGTESFNATDSVKYYLLIDGDSLVFQPQNENHLEYTGFSLLPGASHPIARMMIFDNSFQDMDVELCVYVKPFNAASPIADPDLSDNKDCATIHVMEEPVAGLTEAGQEQLLIFPNPATGILAIESSAAIRSLTIRDASGKTVKTQQAGFSSVDCSDFENGIYFFSVETAAGTEMRRVVISK